MKVAEWLRFRWGWRAVRWKNPDDAAKHPKWPAGAEGGKGGKFAPKQTTLLFRRIMEKLRAGTGFTLDRSLREPTAGFQVAMTGHTKQYPEGRFLASQRWAQRQVEEWLIANAATLDGPDMYLGGWLDEGMVWLEPSKNIPDRATAVRLGQEWDQKEIWDNVAKTGIPTGGKGGFLDGG